MKSINSKEPFMVATRKSVAIEAGVSVATVTHVMSPKPGIKIRPETRKKVLAAAEKMNYRPSYIGTALTCGRTFNIGVLLRTLHHLNYYLYREILIGMGTRMELENYNLTLLFRNPEMRYLDNVREGRVDGVFVLQSDLEDKPIIELAKTGIPLIVVDRMEPIDNQPNVSGVLADHQEMTTNLVADFVEKGCRSLMIINNHNVDSNIRMNQSFLKAAEQYAEDGVIASLMERSNPEIFKSQLRNIIKNNKYPDALFINRIYYAQAACEIITDCGLTLDKDIKVVACEPDIFAPCKYNIEVYSPNAMQMGYKAWELMKKLMKNNNEIQPVEFVPYQKHLANDIAVAPEDQFS
jgi:LacI family transcriptional regulator